MRQVLGFALAAFVVAPVAAADLSVRPQVYAPAVAPPPIYSWWTGCYVGGNGGGAWSRPRYTADNGTFVESFNFNPVGGIGGGHIGCQYQWGGLVLGVEGAWSWTNLRHAQPSLISPIRERSVSIDQIATATGKVGWAFDRTMLYVRAGWAGVRVNGRLLNTVTAEAFDFSDWSNGGTVGVGLEHVPWRSIVVGVEANYYRATFERSGLSTLGNPTRITGGTADIFAVTGRISYLFGQPVPVY